MNDEWAEIELGKLVTIKPGKYLPKSEYVDDGDFFVFGSNSVMGKYDSSLVDTPHVVMAAVGSYAGNVRYSADPSWVNNNAFALLPSGSIDPFFLYLWLEGVLDLGKVLAGTGQPYVKRPNLLSQAVLLPPLPVQRRIVDLMTHLDAHIANLQAERDALGAAVVAFRATTWDELGMPLTPLGDLLHGITAGRSPNTSGERPRPEEQGVLKVNAVDPSGMFFPEEAKVLPEDHGMSPEWELRGGEVLVTRANTAERVAAVARVPSAVRPGLFLCDKTLRLDYDSALIDPNFLVEMLLSPQARAQVSTMATGVGSSMVNLSQAKFRSWEIPAPSLAEQSSIAATATAMKSMLDALDAELRRLGSLRSSLLRGLLGGTVNPNPSYDGLLERAS